MNIQVTVEALANVQAELLALPCSRQEIKEQGETLLASFGIDAAVLSDFKGDAGEMVMLYGLSGGYGAKRVALLGMGDNAKLDDFRKAAVAFASRATDLKVENAALDASRFAAFAESLGESVSSLASIVVESAFRGTYRFNRLKSGKTDKKADDEAASQKPKELATLQLCSTEASAHAELERGVAEGVVLGSCQRMARELVNLPGNYLNAEQLAEAAVASGKRAGYSVKVLHKADIEALSMGGLLGVNKGSHNAPTFSILDYTPKGEAQAVIALVGKGVTFDSGGISIKPSENMGEMKSDMAGAATVIAAVEAAARLELPLRIVGFVPATDNMPSGTAQQPGDVLTTMSGITVEVSNTDAEGRLILADALTYAVKNYQPDAVIDLATLTGACIVALGYSVAGLFSNNDALANKLFTAGERMGEKVWRLPLWDLYDEQIKSDVADVNNTGGRGAGTITAAKFLEKFIDGHSQWAHIDIAGPSFVPKSGGKANGGTGFGVRLLVDAFKHWA